MNETFLLLCKNKYLKNINKKTLADNGVIKIINVIKFAGEIMELKNMGFTKEQFEEIGDYVKSRFHIVENEVRNETRFEQIILRIDHNNELMREGFKSIDKRLEAVDKRFEDMTHNMDKRFETMDKRFENMTQNTNKRFEDMTHNMDKRFNQFENYMKVFIGMGFTTGFAILMKLYF